MELCALSLLDEPLATLHSQCLVLPSLGRFWGGGSRGFEPADCHYTNTEQCPASLLLPTMTCLAVLEVLGLHSLARPGPWIPQQAVSSELG